MKPVGLKTLLSLILIFALVGCAGMKGKKGASSADNMQSEDSMYADGNYEMELYGTSDSMKAGGLRTIYFAYDSANLNTRTKEALNNNADYMKENDSVQIQIEGHCDERGGIQYNLALGERRANTVRNYLAALGIEKSRIRIVSLGKEKPIEFGSNESAWSKNRRANFVVTAK